MPGMICTDHFFSCSISSSVCLSSLRIERKRAQMSSTCSNPVADTNAFCLEKKATTHVVTSNDCAKNWASTYNKNQSVVVFRNIAIVSEQLYEVCGNSTNRQECSSVSNSAEALDLTARIGELQKQLPFTADSPYAAPFTLPQEGLIGIPPGSVTETPPESAMIAPAPGSASEGAEGSFCTRVIGNISNGTIVNGTCQQVPTDMNGELSNASIHQEGEGRLNLPLWAAIVSGTIFLVAACVGMAIYRSYTRRISLRPQGQAHEASENLHQDEHDSAGSEISKGRDSVKIVRDQHKTLM